MVWKSIPYDPINKNCIFEWKYEGEKDPKPIRKEQLCNYIVEIYIKNVCNHEAIKHKFREKKKYTGEFRSTRGTAIYQKKNQLYFMVLFCFILSTTLRQIIKIV